MFIVNEKHCGLRLGCSSLQPVTPTRRKTCQRFLQVSEGPHLNTGCTQREGCRKTCVAATASAIQCICPEEKTLQFIPVLEAVVSIWAGRPRHTPLFVYFIRTKARQNIAAVAGLAQSPHGMCPHPSLSHDQNNQNHLPKQLILAGHNFHKGGAFCQQQWRDNCQDECFAKGHCHFAKKGGGGGYFITQVFCLQWGGHHQGRGVFQQQKGTRYLGSDRARHTSAL